MTSISLLVTTLDKSGPGKGISLLVEGLKDKGYPIRIVEIKSDRNSSLFLYLSDIRRTYQLLKGGYAAGDILHTSGIIPDLLGLLISFRVKSVKWVTTIRSEIDKDLQKEYGLLIGYLISILWMLILKRCRYLCIHSEHMKRYYKRKGFRDTNLFVCPNGVKIRPRKNAKNVSNKRWLYVGRLIERKRVHIILRALAKNELFTLTILGDGPLRNELMSLSKELGISERVNFVGWVEDVDQYYKTHDVFVLPSSSEGLSRALLEAAACGLLLCTSDIPANKVIVEHVKTGLIFNDEHDLSDCFEIAKNVDLVDSMRLEGYRLIIKKFSLEKMLSSYVGVYQA